MKHERRPLITDRVAQVFVVVVFALLFTPLAGREVVHTSARAGWIIYPLMVIAYDRFLFLTLLTAVVVIIIHWINLGAFWMSSDNGESSGKVAALIVIGCGLCAGTGLTFFNLSQYVGETQRITVQGRHYLAVPIIGENPDSFIYEYDYHIMQCGFGAIHCEYLDRAYSHRDMIRSEPAPQVNWVHDDTMNRIRLLVDGETIHIIPDVSDR